MEHDKVGGDVDRTSSKAEGTKLAINRDSVRRHKTGKALGEDDNGIWGRLWL